MSATMSEFLAELRVIYPRARAADVAELGPWLTVTMARHDIHTPLRMAHFLAQVGHESGQLRYREELASGAAYEGRADLGNTQRGDGVRFKGRGLIQLTGRANYRQYDEQNNWQGKLLADPDRVALDPEVCVDVAGWYWQTRALNRLADQDDLRGITRAINGGLNGLQDRQLILARAKTRLAERAAAAADPVPDIQALQRRLNAAGARPALAVDGILGPRTTAALQAFQRRRGLPADGAVDAATWRALTAGR